MNRWPLVLLAGLLVGACTDDSGKDSVPTGTLDDADGDGFPSVEDCDDSDPAVNPGATEICDSVDNNCDGAADEAGATGGTPYYTDGDADTYGDDASLAYACTAPSGSASQGGDCDDTNGAVSPGSSEVCDSVDNDCDGDVDDADASVSGLSTFYQDLDGDGFGDSDFPAQACAEPANYTAEPTDCDDDSATNYPGATEVCDDADNNCDSNVDEGLASSTYYADLDGDGYGDPNSTLDACAMPSRYVADNTDCDDSNGGANPGLTEVCDASDIDEDCDGLADTADSGATGLTTYYADADADGYGDAANSVDACEASAGYGTDASDCDDARSDVNPLGTEVCDDVDADENCDGSADDADVTVADQEWYFADADGDGYGDVNDSGTLTCEMAAGWTDTNTDCADSDAAINPGAQEMCDDLDADEDCDGLVDDADDSVSGQSDWYIDSDGDGGGDDSVMVTTCDQPSGYVDNATDPYEDLTVTGGFTSGLTDLAELRDVVVYDRSLYAVGTNSVGDGIVVVIDLDTSVGATVYAGAPLAEPSGIEISQDGMTLYVADVAAENSQGDLGELFSLGISGSTPASIDLMGTLRMPTDVSADDNGDLWLVGKSPEDTAAYAQVSGGAWVGTWSFGSTGAGLTEPMAVSASPDGSMLFVLDAMSSGRSRGALVSITDPGGAGTTALLATGLRVAYGNGLAVDGSGSSIVYATLADKSFGYDDAAFESGFYTIGADGGNNRLSFLQVDTLATGLSASGGELYYADLTGIIYSSTY